MIQGGEKNVVDISREIAISHNLIDGDSVQIRNERGQLDAIVRIDEGLQKDTINIDEGRWKGNGGSVNLLTPSGESDMGKGSILYDCFVAIKKNLMLPL
ncbi:MAG: hypothetical protein LRY73_14535 [Bacillus sp. (in: Bacteria)]|nr:hypothetical protein [Bacillus sp. (in: firmicutes)]